MWNIFDTIREQKTMESQYFFHKNCSHTKSNIRIFEADKMTIFHEMVHHSTTDLGYTLEEVKVI